MTQGVSGEDALKKVQSHFVTNLVNEAEQQLGQQQNNQQQANTTDNPLMSAINTVVDQQPPITNVVGHNPQGEQAQAPVVMGSEGNVGSGVPAPQINFGKLKSDDVNSIVAQALANTDNA
jgi:hypothetical protein